MTQNWMRPRSRELLQNIQTCKKGGRKRQKQGERLIKKKKALEAVRKHTGERGQQLWAREQRSITCNLKDAQFYRVIEKAKAKWIRVYNEAFARSYGFKALNWLKAINKNAHNRMTVFETAHPWCTKADWEMTPQKGWSEIGYSAKSMCQEIAGSSRIPWASSR